MDLQAGIRIWHPARCRHRASRPVERPREGPKNKEDREFAPVRNASHELGAGAHELRNAATMAGARVTSSRRPSPRPAWRFPGCGERPTSGSPRRTTPAGAVTISGFRPTHRRRANSRAVSSTTLGEALSTRWPNHGPSSGIAPTPLRATGTSFFGRHHAERTRLRALLQAARA